MKLTVKRPEIQSTFQWQNLNPGGLFERMSEGVWTACMKTQNGFVYLDDGTHFCTDNADHTMSSRPLPEGTVITLEVE